MLSFLRRGFAVRSRQRVGTRSIPSLLFVGALAAPTLVMCTSDTGDEERASEWGASRAGLAFVGRDDAADELGTVSEYVRDASDAVAAASHAVAGALSLTSAGCSSVAGAAASLLTASWDSVRDATLPLHAHAAGGALAAPQVSQRSDGDPWADLNDSISDAFGAPARAPTTALSRGGGGSGGGSRAREWLTGRTLCYSIAGVNGIVYLLWQVQAPGVQRVMADYFLTSAGHLRGHGFADDRGQAPHYAARLSDRWASGRSSGDAYYASRRRWNSLYYRASGPASSLLSTYSHSSFWHLAANMMGLLSFGPQMIDARDSVQAPRLSPAEFFAMYTAAGIAGSVASSGLQAWARSSRPGLGASGSIFGLVTYFAMGRPDHGVTVMLLINLTAAQFMALATAGNAWLVFKEVQAARLGTRGPMIDGTAHLAGTAVGVLAYALARARAQRRQEQRQRGGR